jgi:eukaryotic-like serine/threonine-protein kinase
VRDRFQQEARLLTLVQSEHVVGVRDHGETDDGYLYLVLDRLSGETLADRLARPPRLAWRDAAAIALELARGLAALHARGIVHRDLKPANVILHRGEGGAPVAKIVDLGISKVGAAAADPVLFAKLTATGEVLGTPQYMSHEQALGERDVDARTDVWALGVVLHEMLTGRRPFDGDNVNAVLAAIRRGPPPTLAASTRPAPEALARVVERCLARSRDGRYRDGEVLSQALAAAIQRGAEEEARAGRSRRRVIAGGAVLLAAAVAASLLFAPKRSMPPSPDAVRAAVVAAPAQPAPIPTGPPAAPRPPPTAPPATPSAPSPPKPGRALTRVNSAGF